MTTDWQEIGSELQDVLHLQVAPIAISFSAERPEGVAPFDAPMSTAEPDGRQGRVPAGCVFWMRATEQRFSTIAEDHGNCSVGSYTHGFKSLEEVASNSDVAALLGSGWVTGEAVMGIPQVAERPGAVTYGPLAEHEGDDPDVVLVRVNGRQMMVLSDALPGLRIEGKPQCHIVAIAKNEQVPAASVGCALSRARTGMGPDEMTCALPGSKLPEILGSIKRTAEIDTVVAKYAANDARKFAPAR